MTGAEIRKSFTDFFVSKGHKNVKSSNLVPSADPTLLFTNAGMVPFKDVFLGNETRDYKRAVSCQKCLRVSGKHNDLEEVGRTNRHNTFFEMLGNFSFGDYFKEDAIKYGWEFLTEVLELPKEKLWVSVFEKDNEAERLWLKTDPALKGRIVRLGEKDNFWSMGATGPCGPCSEIFIDHGESAGCKSKTCSVGCDCDRYEEIWNLVFMQYNRDGDGNLTDLPNPSIDTGMGLERLASILQGVASNFDTDLIRPIIAKAEDVLGKSYGDNNEDDVSLRVIGDHIRTATFLITEGILPSNDDRGYVLRRIMRRAMRHGKMLGATEPFLYKVIGSVVDNFKSAYPELTIAEASMATIIKVEEERFSKTLDTGVKMLNDLVEKTKSDNKTEFDASELFKLYDTYGFPVDLAEDIISDSGLTYAKEDFEKELETSRTLARSSAKTVKAEILPVYSSLSKNKTDFRGYDLDETQTNIVAIVKDGKEVKSLSSGEGGEIFLANTPFYAESGGQVGDRGTITSNSSTVRVADTYKPAPDLFAHKVSIVSGTVKKGDEVTAHIDVKRREAIRRNHSATHLLQSALKKVLGEHVKQSGSYVDPDRLRFDFSHYASLSSAELADIEKIVNGKIRKNIQINTREISTDKAIEEGATALFGEKYGDMVRVVNMLRFSTELCGGTHANSTGEISLFKITAETGVAAGIRRIEAITGEVAFYHIQNTEKNLKAVSSLLKCSAKDTLVRVEKLLEQNKEQEKTIKKLKAQKVRDGGSDKAKEKEIEGIKVVTKNLDSLDLETLRMVVDEMKVKIGSGVVLAATVDDGKVILIAGVTKDLTKKVHAGKIAKVAANIVGGGGGGRPDMAQAGGTDISKVDDALDSVFESVASQLS